ncbi:MAG: alcohol dehydrogenase catalytic domain-containing protein [Thermodesulfobacteriota bacterium]
MTGMMEAVRFHAAGDLRHERVPRPTGPGPGEVRVRIAAAGICGSDLHVARTGAYITRTPVIMGHEFAGEILELGQGVAGLSPGDHVVGDSRVACGQCGYCRQNLPNLCDRLGFLGEVRDGAFAEEIVLGASRLVKIDQAVPWAVAALAEPLAVARHALSQARPSPSTRTLILGAGPIGALIHQLTLLEGVKKVTVHDASAYRRRLLAQARPGSVAEPSGHYDLVFETTGSGRVLAEVVPAVLRKKGTLVMVGLFGAKVSFNFNLVVENEWTVQGCAAFSSELPEAARILGDHYELFDHVVSHRIPLREYQTAFDTLFKPEKQALKIVFQPDLK